MKDLQVYQVGGVVRDTLLGQPVSDRDWVVVGATVQQMLDLGYRQVGRDFPVFLHPQTQEEYALARTERKTAAGYHGFQFDTSPGISLEADLARRDLTINAMAMDAQGQIIDPYAGQADLRNKILRHVSDAFVEDPLRVLRVARFAARFGFEVADETRELMTVMVENGEINALTPERVWTELHKALATSRPPRFFSVLRDCGALAVLFPEIEALFGVPQKKQYHPEVDTGVHVMMVLEQAALLSKETTTRFAALCHDLGKGNTPADILPSHIGHEERGVKLVKALCRRIRAPNDHRDLAVMTARYHTHCHRAFELKPGTVLKLIKSTDALRRPQRFEAFLLACSADFKGRTGYEAKPYPQADHMRQVLAALQPINARALADQGLEGNEIAKALDRLRIQAIKNLAA